ncbi:LpxL/LpxP family Kdo(2)-lipid IV(A) lauroyl/palmitoleoyl acyltransferase [Photorhabdus laumondii subsp. laumondii]|uniref:Lipid A biosynthesis acyltransferase n=1 Tax=Photorhabdus laumondii subsp. laumondii TaxID=141679 RepID=A0A6L9JH65_PHOLM|nr:MULTISPECIES: Kdo(2)-lipid IV(A) acyltransferase [Photorhabdus]AWK41637.1 lipid A biosynthesis lauroyl acyltransferase [Photorhabdus laumondii subsp. laumondii]AXG42475.1 lipid A biosynthesis lauroyl acyltransferase [Photorhabdus laumondii subsp. laumondii]MCC8386045.1 LpxL/LpxP family Kdo(2)-lipid IV(A) lauroyl/palmitoleoyl acyltransferasee [Photorhabdus laumondii]MCC8390278.1 LpxL/LpxP family Kdo(2)-lipid IV(A) lauroyl/palmitoleoyl acyltransferasee [Photorhabdus laumondii]MCC8415219.1 Lpx
MIQAPSFQRSLLHPRYWPTWFGISLLYLLVLLPYPIIYRIGTRLGRFSMHFLKKRAKVAERNLELCFPDMPQEERNALLIKNFESVGMGIFETGMAWFWPDWRIERWFKVTGQENIQKIQTTGQGIIVIGIHFLTLELGARILGLLNPGIGVYRPNDNPVMDWLQTWGRLRSNKYMLDRKDVKGMIRCLKNGEIVWYAPDHDYGPRKSVFAPLFAVEHAATTTGTSILVRLADPAMIPFTPRRLPDGKGYELIIQPTVAGFPKDDEVKAAAFMNRVVEQEILQAPDQYMWLHRRFKTRPKGMPSLYGQADKVH